MSDAYYREQAKKRARRWWLTIGAAALVGVALLGAHALLYDACTRSYDRSPVAIVRSYVDAVQRGDGPAAQECWAHHAFYDIGAGCSEICLARVYGAQFQIVDLFIGGQYLTPEPRTNLVAKVEITCSASGEGHRGEIVLDTVAANLSWRHWQIVQSTFGGSVAQPWCR